VGSELLIERHIRELWYRRLYCLLGWVCGSLLLLYYSELWLQWLISPLPSGSNGVFLSLWGNVQSSFKVAISFGLLFRLPLSLWQLWCFAGPGLTETEQKLWILFRVQSLCCGLFSVWLWWYYLLPRICTFCLGWSRGSKEREWNLLYLPEVVVYLDFALSSLFALLVRLQLFPLLVGGIALKLWSVFRLGRRRRLVYLGLLVFATLVSPPDVGSQVLLTGPLIVCFELSLFVGSFLRQSPNSDFRVLSEEIRNSEQVRC